VTLVVVEDREVLQPLDSGHQRREAVEEKTEECERRRRPNCERTTPGQPGNGEGNCAHSPAEEREMHGDRTKVRQPDPASADSNSDDEPDECAERDQDDADRDFASSRRERSIGCASVRARMPASSSPAVPAATEIPVKATTSSPYTAPISLRIQPVIVP
jgi:hypothetical protein